MIRSVLKTLTIVGALAGTFGMTSAFALNASQIVEREVKVHNADGTVSLTREKADMVTPGDKVVYSLNYHNDDANPASNIVLVMPVPTQVAYFEGSAELDGTIANYSADGGQTYAARHVLQVKQSDGLTRMAESADITHIRWQVQNPVAPGAHGVLSFKGQLK